MENESESLPSALLPEPRGGHEVGGCVALRVVALISFRLPVIDKPWRRNRHRSWCRWHLPCPPSSLSLDRDSRGNTSRPPFRRQGYARFGLPGKTAVRACCGGEFHIVIDYRPIAHKVESAGVTGGKLGTVTVLGSTGSGFLRAVSRSCQGIAAVGDGDGEPGAALSAPGRGSSSCVQPVSSSAAAQRVCRIFRFIVTLFILTLRYLFLSSLRGKDCKRPLPQFRL